MRVIFCHLDKLFTFAVGIVISSFIGFLTIIEIYSKRPFIISDFALPSTFGRSCFVPFFCNDLVEYWHLGSVTFGGKSLDS